MEKIQEYKYIIILGLTSLILGFYWFQLRPSLIKKNCSLTTKTIQATPEVTKKPG